MAHYIIQTLAFQVFFLLVYDLFLKKETFFNWNRMYLLSTAILSLVLPFIKIDRFRDVVPQDYMVSLPEIILGQPDTVSNTGVMLDAVVLNTNSWSVWEVVFCIGLGIALILFIWKLVKILVLIIKNPRRPLGKVILVELINSSAAFSFFHYIFLGEHIKAEDKETILKHELIHTQEKHTLDLLLFEVLRILFWFNPLVYMYQHRLAMLHEFIADANALKHQDKETYYQNLLAQVFETKNISFINTFFNQSSIKKRIVMLSKSKSKQIHLFKYALLIPLVFGMLMYTSAEAQSEIDKKESIDLSQYSYTLKKGEELVGAKKEIHDKYQAFLLKNKNYVSWAQINEDNQSVTYSVHSINEGVPEYLSKSNVDFGNGDSYVMYINWPKSSIQSEEKKWIQVNKSGTDVPFLELDRIPIFPGCEGLSKEELKGCTTEKITKHIVKFFNTEIGVKLGLTGRQRINAIFKINKDGQIEGVRSRAPHPELEAEAIRVIKTLPKMIPGEHNGKPVVVPYSLPIIFQIQRDDPAVDTNIDVPFSVIEQPPVFPGCENLSAEEQKDCSSRKIKMHVNRNFNTELATELGLYGRQRINVIFKINKEGDITEIKSRAPHPGLEAEAVRVISTLPKMIPGKQKGKTVSVPYSLPIIFQVADPKPRLEEGEVPLAVIEEVPVFPGCESLESNAERKKCMTEKIAEFVGKNFRTKIADSLGLVAGRQRINVIFKVDKFGAVNLDDIRARAAHPRLEEEAIRVISQLPKMKPGIQRGKAVTVPYALPIIFEIEDDTQMLNEVAIVGYGPQLVDVPFSVVEELPIFPGCEGIKDRKESKKCTSDAIKSHVNKNFNTKLAKKLKLHGRQRINAIFKIDTEGGIKDVKSRAPHPDLEAEAIRVIKTLPKMIPGKQKGKAVNVPFSLPIIFQVND